MTSEVVIRAVWHSATHPMHQLAARTQQNRPFSLASRLLIGSGMGSLGMRPLVSVAFASALAFVATGGGCGGAPSGLDRSAYAVDVCKQGRWSELDGVALVASSGYLQLDVATSGVIGESLQSVSHTGTSCTSATDAVACTSALSHARSEVGWKSERCGGAGCSRELRFFVRESGGVLETVTRVERLAALVAPIDSPAKAALIAAYAFDPTGIECAGPQIALRASDSSYEVFLAHGGGCTDRVERRARVTREGAATELESTTIPSKQSCVSP